MITENPAASLPQLVGALVDAAKHVGTLQLPGNDLDEEKAREALVSAQTKFFSQLDKLNTQAIAFRSTQRLPSTLDDAIMRVQSSQAYYDVISRKYLDVYSEWSAADCQQSRIRLRCVEALMTPIDQGGRALAWSRANEEASAHPDYTEHKDRTAGLAREKEALSVEMQVAAENVRNARVILQAFITTEQSRDLRTLVVAGDRTKETQS